MEFNEKLQMLRKQKSYTQEELAERLFVSRTAVSKWESGRGYPNIDSLKSIAKLFSISLDELLSSEELLFIAQEEQSNKEKHMCDMIFGLLDLSILLLFFLPFFRQFKDGTIQGVSLLELSETSIPVKAIFCSLAASMAIMGVCLLALQNCENSLWVKSKYFISAVLTLLCVFVFAISMHPYATAYLLLFLLIKLIIWRKKR